MNEDDGVALFLSSKYDELGGLTFYNLNQINETIPTSSSLTVVVVVVDLVSAQHTYV